MKKHTANFKLVWFLALMRICKFNSLKVDGKVTERERP